MFSMIRPDISKYLIHFTRDTTDENAFKRLQKIIRDKKLIGSSNKIKGDHRCVCFSEAPLSSLQDGLVNENLYSKYSPFGIMVSKKLLFERGGRPVIYQPAPEYNELPHSYQWRHVTFELRNGLPFSDFTWEREWRIKCDELPFDCSNAKIVVRDSNWAARLKRDHEDNQEYNVQMYSLIMGDIAELYREPIGWTITQLR
jgi:hypothetical protein